MNFIETFLSDIKARDQRMNIFLLVDMNSPEKIFEEAEIILRRISTDIDLNLLRKIYNDIVSLYCGGYPGYKACNTEYHDLRHTTDVFLCMTRLIHGLSLGGAVIDPKSIFLSLTAAIFHDTGYIQEVGDDEGTGARHTREHVTRSIDFMSGYFRKNSFPEEDFEIAQNIILATSHNMDARNIPEGNGHDIRMLGVMFASDIIGQMSDRAYLEKLLLLFQEFREAEIEGFDTEFDLLKKTRIFSNQVRERLDGNSLNYKECFRRHFMDRWGIDSDFYVEAMEGNLNYLSRILDESGENYRSRLKRFGIVKMIEEKKV